MANVRIEGGVADLVELGKASYEQRANKILIGSEGRSVTFLGQAWPLNEGTSPLETSCQICKNTLSPLRKAATKSGTKSDR